MIASHALQEWLKDKQHEPACIQRVRDHFFDRLDFGTDNRADLQQILRMQDGIIHPSPGRAVSSAYGYSVRPSGDTHSRSRLAVIP